MPTVLIVDDEADVLVLASSIVEDAGFNTLSAANATEALALLHGRAAVDVLFTDITMPGGMDGIGLAREATGLRPGLRVVYTTGGVVTDGTQALFVDGARFLGKPYSRDQLIDALRGAAAD